jgi:chromosome transmission fidelity protein 1
MKPTDEFKNDLFSSSSSASTAHQQRSVHEFSCGHVVSPSNVLCVSLAKGPSGKSLDFDFQRRSQTVEELGTTLCSVVGVVPGGFVVFFPSYGFEAECHRVFEKNGVLARLKAKKTLFRYLPKKSGGIERDKPDNVCQCLVYPVVHGKRTLTWRRLEASLLANSCYL